MNRLILVLAVAAVSLTGQSNGGSYQDLSPRELVERAERQANLNTCLDGRYPSLCKHSLLSTEEVSRVSGAEHAANLRTCLDGRYPALCGHQRLVGSEVEQVKEAERRANLRTCADGRYAALCNHSLLSTDETSSVSSAEHSANLRTCVDGRYTALCRHATLSESEAKVVKDAERRENLKVCLDGRYPALCNRSLLDESQNTQELTESVRSPQATPISASAVPTAVERSTTSQVQVTSGAPQIAPSVGCAENGSCYGDLSPLTGRPKTVEVHGYYRKDGTYVRGYYRSRPRR